MVINPRISQATFSGKPKRRLYFISFGASYVEIGISGAGDIDMDVSLNEEPPSGMLGEWIEQVSKDAAEAFGGDATQLSNTIVKGLYDS